MLLFDQLNKGDRPLRMVAWGVALGLFILLGGLWKVQVMSAAKYRERQEVQSFRTVRVPAMRGKILDRYGRELAGNTPRYRLSLYLDELRPQFQAEYRRQRTNYLFLKRLDSTPAPETLFSWIASKFRPEKRSRGLTTAEVDYLNRSARYSVVSNTIVSIYTRMAGSTNVRFFAEDQFHDYWLTKRALPMPVIQECTPQQIASITEQGWSIPGARLELVPIRSYPNGKLAVHLIGHLKRNDEYDEEEEGRFDYRQRDYVGGNGLEKAYDTELRGIAGARSILVNSLGYRHQHGEQELAEPQPGLNLVTTLDIDLQRAVETALTSVSGDERGAAVVMDVTNGDVLALASAPAFDPSEFIDGVSTYRWTNVLMAEPARPMFNRATYGEYAPGSTFKILNALAMLENGTDPNADYVVAPDPARPGRGAYYLGRRKIEDTAPAGVYDFRRAFIRSSNSYFIDHGIKLGWEKLLAMGHQFGLGEDTGIKIEEVKNGFFPTTDYVGREGWNAGNLANVSIGQQITLTPLQLAVAISAVANGGKVFWPRVVDRIEPNDPLSEEPVTRVRPGQVRSEIKVTRRNLDIVRAAMRDDVSDNEGSGKAARLEGFAVCGKTGTAEIKGNGRKDKVTWFASYGPYESPRYAVIVMVESGASGGGTCAPVAKQIYQFLRDRERNPARRLAQQ